MTRRDDKTDIIVLSLCGALIAVTIGLVALLIVTWGQPKDAQEQESLKIEGRME